MNILSGFPRPNHLNPFLSIITVLALALWPIGPLAYGQLNSTSTPRTTPTYEQHQFGLQQNWQLTLSDEQSTRLTKPLWVQQKEVGFGFSQVVGGNGQNAGPIFIASGNRTKDKKTIQSTVKRYDSMTSKSPAWTFEFKSKLRGNQQTFSGSPPSSQSTPLLVDNYLIHLTFTGHLTCLEQATGKQVWQQDAVTQFDGEPVQFGYSSSPIANPIQPGQFLILLAGKAGGLLNLDAATGKILWKSPCESFSYATPVQANFGGVRQLVISSQNRIIGVDLSDGKQLWDFPMTEKGLTNVPAPIVIDDRRMVASCQGLKGARGLQVTRNAQDRWQVKELWHQPRMQFFYTNWLKLDHTTVIGCIDKLLVVFDATTGQIRGKFRGFTDGNLIDLGDGQFVIVDGKGTLSRLIVQRDKSGLATRLTQTHTFPILKAFQPGRVWTPLSKVGSTLFLRSEDQLISIALSDEHDQYHEVASTLSQNRVFELEPFVAKISPQPNHVEAIMTIFESEGQQAAWQKYQTLRKQGKLKLDDRIELIEAAQSQRLTPLVQALVKDAAEDFPGKETEQRLRPFQR